MPSISIIIPAFNAADHIAATLASVLAQCCSGFEVLVIDDGSSDDTASYLATLRDARIRVLRQPHGGAASARNRGIARATGDYLLFLDADDLLTADALERHLAGFRRHPRAVMTYGEAATFDGDGGPPEPRPRRPMVAARPQGDGLPALLTANPVGSAMVSRKAVDRTRGFRPVIELGEDWVFWCEVATLGEVAYLGPAPLLYYRMHPASTARRLAPDPARAQPAIDAIFDLAAVRRRFPAPELARFRRHAEASCFAYAATEHLKNRRWMRARQAFARAFRYRPRPREALLWTCATLHLLPRPLRARLK